MGPPVRFGAFSVCRQGTPAAGADAPQDTGRSRSDDFPYDIETSSDEYHVARRGEGACSFERRFRIGRRFAVQPVPGSQSGEFRNRQGARRIRLGENVVRFGRQEWQDGLQFLVGRESQHHVEPFVPSRLQLTCDFGHAERVVPAVGYRERRLGEYLPASGQTCGGRCTAAAVEQRPRADGERRAATEQTDGSAGRNQVFPLVGSQQVETDGLRKAVPDAAQSEILQWRACFRCMRTFGRRRSAERRMLLHGR